MRVLAVEVDEPLAQLLQLRERGGAAVDPRAALALRVEHAAQQHVAVVGRDALLRQPGADAGRVRDRELGGELGARRARAELAHLETVAEQQAQRVEQDRLARAGFAGEHREARRELDVERLDDDEIADGQRAQHRGQIRNSFRSGAPRHWSLLRSDPDGGSDLRMRSGVSLQCSFSRSIAK